MADPGRLDELKRKFDENPKRYFAPLANEYRKTGDAERAIELCRTYLPQQPNHMSGYIVYGQALHDAGQGEESAAVFKQALTLDPENIIALRHLGDISRNAGDNVGAMRWYGKVLELDPRNDEVSAFVDALSAPGTKAFVPPVTPERQPPPTVRPEPEPDASAVRLEDIFSEPDVAQTPYMTETASVREPAELPDPAPVHEPVHEPAPTIGDDAPFEVTQWPAATDTGVSSGSGTVIEGPWHAEAETLSDLPHASESDVERDAPLRLSDFMPDEDTAFAPTADETQDASVTAAEHAGSERDVSPEMPSEPIDAGGEDHEPAAEESAPETASAAEQAAAPDGSAKSTTAPSPFVTETMAELYLSQGMRGEALVIYRQLVLTREDPGLRQKIADLESSESGPTVSRETVRAFFARIGSQRPQEQVRMAAEQGSPLGALFGSASSDASDVAAAQRLSGAFGNPQSGASRS